MIRINTKQLVGCDEIQASNLISVAGGFVNITMRDGIPQTQNTDFRMDRVNLELRGNKVTKAYVG